MPENPERLENFSRMRLDVVLFDADPRPGLSSLYFTAKVISVPPRGRERDVIVACIEKFRAKTPAFETSKLESIFSNREMRKEMIAVPLANLGGKIANQQNMLGAGVLTNSMMRMGTDGSVDFIDSMDANGKRFVLPVDGRNGGWIG